MSETLREFVDSRGVSMAVDSGAGILRGVKVLGLRSRNGRTYLAEALELGAPLYEGAKVNVNHPKVGPLSARDYQDRIGNLRNIVVRAGEGLFADFHFNPKHVLAEQLVWDAEHAPENVGFSHNVLARTARRGRETVVEAITKVQSVDLVADPATTQGLFESVVERQTAATGQEGETLPAAGDGSALEQTDALEPMRARLAAAEAELNELRESESQARRQALIYRLLAETGLRAPEDPSARSSPVITERFLETLAQAPDEQTVRELIRDRVELVASLSGSFGRADSKPRSRDQSLIGGPRPGDAVSFVKAIT